MASKTRKSNKIKTAPKYLDLLYMTPSEAKARDIANQLTPADGVKIEVWNELNILEIELPNTNTVDVEPLDVHLLNCSDKDFMKKGDIQAVYTIRLREEDLSTVIHLFKKIIAELNGFICADTEDFHPVYIGSSSNHGDKEFLI